MIWFSRLLTTCRELSFRSAPNQNTDSCDDGHSEVCSKMDRPCMWRPVGPVASPIKTVLSESSPWAPVDSGVGLDPPLYWIISVIIPVISCASETFGNVITTSRFRSPSRVEGLSMAAMLSSPCTDKTFNLQSKSFTLSQNHSGKMTKERGNLNSQLLFPDHHIAWEPTGENANLTLEPESSESKPPLADADHHILVTIKSLGWLQRKHGSVNLQVFRYGSRASRWFDRMSCIIFGIVENRIFFWKILDEKNFVCFPGPRNMFILIAIIFHRSRYLISRCCDLLRNTKSKLLMFELDDWSIRYVICFCCFKNNSILTITWISYTVTSVYSTTLRHTSRFKIPWIIHRGNHKKYDLNWSSMKMITEDTTYTKF